MRKSAAPCNQIITSKSHFSHFVHTKGRGGAHTLSRDVLYSSVVQYAMLQGTWWFHKETKWLVSAFKFITFKLFLSENLLSQFDGNSKNLLQNIAIDHGVELCSASNWTLLTKTVMLIKCLMITAFHEIGVVLCFRPPWLTSWPITTGGWGAHYEYRVLHVHSDTHLFWTTICRNSWTLSPESTSIWPRALLFLWEILALHFSVRRSNTGTLKTLHREHIV